MFTPTPIAYVRSPYTESSAIPKGLNAKHEAEGAIEFLREYEAGLTDIEGFSHLFVLWVFDRSTDFDLVARPPSDAGNAHGVFATRSPRRPNPIGLTVVELLGRDGTSLRVRGVDMLDGTPVLDVKPCMSSIPAEKLRRGWLAEAEQRKETRPVLAPILTSVAAHLYVRDVQASADFFVGKLGFAVDFIYGEPPFYGQVSRDRVRLALRSMDEPFFAEDIREREGLLSASITLASAEEIQQLFATYQAAEAPLAQALRDEPWQAKTFIVKDPDGNLILFAGPSV
jgi:tRNA-Thr(GGU) m(6)t(6)A37 methyltransferase TsaA